RARRTRRGRCPPYSADRRPTGDQGGCRGRRPGTAAHSIAVGLIGPTGRTRQAQPIKACRYGASMLSTPHEALVDMFRHQPTLAPVHRADALKIDIPAHKDVRLESAEVTDMIPTQYRADAVIVLSNEEGPVLAIVVEAQLSCDPDKWWRWPAY